MAWCAASHCQGRKGLVGGETKVSFRTRLRLPASQKADSRVGDGTMCCLALLLATFAIVSRC